MRAILAALFGAVVRVRNAAYDRGLFTAHRIAVPVLSVGNITLGGAGKTPLVEHLVSLLHDEGVAPCVVTRGYGRVTRGTVVVSDARGTIVTAREGGDEPVQMARKFPWLPIVADGLRVRGCGLAIERFQPDVIVLDDAFQHRACARDLDIVAIDAARADTELRMAPLGRLREPLAHLRRASLIVLTRCSDTVQVDVLAARLSSFSDAPIVRTRFAIAALRDALDGRGVGMDAVQERVIAFCGIGSPDAFRTTLAEAGLATAALRAFPDHHTYAARDLEALRVLARRHDTQTFVTTEKDVARLGAAVGGLSDFRILYPEMITQVLEGADLLRGRVFDSMRRA